MAVPQYEKGKLYNIYVIDFRKDPNQPRKYFDSEALEELAASIKKHGILLPVLFLPGDQGWLNIVAGDRKGKTPGQYVALIADMEKKLGQLDRSAWTEEENTAFRDGLANLRDTVKLLLDSESPNPVRILAKSRQLS